MGQDWKLENIHSELLRANSIWHNSEGVFATFLKKNKPKIVDHIGRALHAQEVCYHVQETHEKMLTVCCNGDHR